MIAATGGIVNGSNLGERKKKNRESILRKRHKQREVYLSHLESEGRYDPNKTPLPKPYPAASPKVNAPTTVADAAVAVVDTTSQMSTRRAEVPDEDGEGCIQVGCRGEGGGGEVGWWRWRKRRRKAEYGTNINIKVSSSGAVSKGKGGRRR
mmetsp:Transcript_1828/g.3470  ORF Transcript_1828/g.3470 Transcript_1828/m.3470 type:complete len:151 (+) Transcript_1828:1467-1919(+)